MSVASEPSLAVGPTTAQAAPAPPVPVFSVWDSTAGETADVLLHWHRSLPEMPEDDEPLCILQLHMGQNGQGQELEFLEARLQKHHLQPPLAAWSTTQLQRLMAVMAEQRRGAPPNHDEVRLRRAPGRLVIDVHFRSQVYGGTGISLSGCVVEILNAYSSGRSARSDTLEVLRAVAAAQALHTKAIAESRVSMEGLQSEMDRLEGDWTKACAGAKKRHRGLLQRFALVLQAKIDKERALHEELQVRRWNQQGAAAAAAAPKPAAVEEPMEVRGRGRRGRGGGRRGRGRGAAVLEGERPRSPRGDKRPWDEVDDAPAAPGSPAGRAAGTLPAGTVTQGLMMPPPTVTSGMPPTMSLFDPPSDEEPVPARDLTVAAPAAAPPKPEEPALPKGPPRPAGVSTTDDLFFSDGDRKSVV